jgi:murein DD-endopeptidase MepM/ murein hydrolase activator NlpD
MPKTKYFFDPQSLSYKEAKRGWKFYVLNGLGFLSASFVLGIGLFFFFSGIVDSPKEIILKKENAELKEQLTQIEKQMQQMNTALSRLIKRDEDIYRTIFEAEPLNDRLLSNEVATPNTDKLRKSKQDEFLFALRTTADNLEQRLKIQEKSYLDLIKMAESKKKLIAAIPSIQPVANKDLNRLASGFGYRIDPFYRTKKFHSGIDFSASRGTEVYATADGVVQEVVTELWGYGKHIIINHGFGYKTLYAHLSKFDVKKGQRVTRGQLIGRLGSTGKSTAPHLHYEVHINGQPVNPAYFFHNDLSDDEFRKLIEIASSPNQSFD